MKKDKINVIVAIVLILTPFLGFPQDFRTVIFIIGALIVLVSALGEIRKEYKIKALKEVKDAFVESKPSTDNNVNSSHIADA